VTPDAVETDVLRVESRRVLQELLEAAARGAIPPRPPRSDAGRVFVVGCPRSGTTWVRDLFAGHPRTITGKEPHIYQDVYAPVVRLGRIKGLQRVLLLDARNRQASGGGHLKAWLTRDELLALTTRALASGDVADEELADELVVEIYDQILAARGATAPQVLVDKTPWNLRYADRILGTFPDARLVEVLRDGRDVCVSMQLLERDWTEDDRVAQVEKWVEAVERGNALRESPHADRVLRMRYEDLSADPHGEVARMLGFCGLPASSELVADIVAGADFSVHRRTGTGEFRRLGVVGDWVNHFSPQDEALFLQLAGSALEAAGYAV
jgi:hypothetical protein